MKRIKSYHPKGYTRIVMQDGSQLLTKFLIPKDRYTEVVGSAYEMIYETNGIFAYWSKVKCSTLLLFNVSRIYFN